MPEAKNGIKTLTSEELRAYNGLEHLTEQEANDILKFFKTLALMSCRVYLEKQSEINDKPK